jgi:hypothetical protein
MPNKAKPVVGTKNQKLYANFGEMKMHRSDVVLLNQRLDEWGWRTHADFSRDLIAAIASTGRFLAPNDEGVWELRHVHPVGFNAPANEELMIVLYPFRCRHGLTTPSMATAFDSVWIQAGFQTREDFVRTQINGILITGVHPLVQKVYYWDIPGKEIVK